MFGIPLVKGIIKELPQKPLLKRNRCLRHRLKGFQCDHCLSACPKKSISFAANQITIDDISCTGCFLCIAACPNDALISPEIDLEKLSNLLDDKNDLFFSCPKNKQLRTEQVDIPCVGLFSAELLLAFGLSKISTVTFNIAACQSCENSAAFKVLEQRLKRIKSKTPGHISNKFRLIEGDTEKLKTYENNRRFFLSSIASSVISIAKSQFETQTNEASTPVSSKRYIPHKTKLLSDIVNNNENINDPVTIPHFLYQLEINERCNSCPLCTGICPTGAVKVVKEGKQKRITFNALHCSGCGLCIAFCRNDALTLKTPDYVSENNQTIKEQC